MNAASGGRRSPLLTVLIAIAMLAGCGGAQKASVTKTNTTDARAGKATVNPHYGAPGASIAFLAPRPGTTVRQPIHVRVAVKGFKLDGADLDKTPRKGRGNVQFTMDGGKYDTPRYAGANGKLAVRLGVAGKYSVAVMPSITYTGLPRGKHTLVAALANNDLSQTGVRARIVFTVR